MFSITLDNLPNKRYKIEEARGETLKCIPQRKLYQRLLIFYHARHIKEAMKELHSFIKPLDQLESVEKHHLTII